MFTNFCWMLHKFIVSSSLKYLRYFGNGTTKERQLRASTAQQAFYEEDEGELYRPGIAY